MPRQDATSSTALLILVTVMAVPLVFSAAAMMMKTSPISTVIAMPRAGAPRGARF
jgi:hypothetical protein